MVYNSEKNNIKSYRSANPHSLHESENFILPKIPYFIPKANNQFNCSKENLDFGGRYRILFHLTSTSLEISILFIGEDANAYIGHNQKYGVVND